MTTEYRTREIANIGRSRLSVADHGDRILDTRDCEHWKVKIVCSRPWRPNFGHERLRTLEGRDGLQHTMATEYYMGVSWPGFILLILLLQRTMPSSYWVTDHLMLPQGVLYNHSRNAYVSLNGLRSIIPIGSTLSHKYYYSSYWIYGSL